MKILIISPNSPEISIGGIERYIRNLIHFCQSKPYKVIFLLPSNGEEGYERRNNIVIYQKRFLSVNYRRIFGRREIPKSELEQKSKRFFLFLLNLFDKERIDVVSAQNFHFGLPPVYSLVLNMTCFSKYIPLVLRVHSYANTDIQKEIINHLFWKKIICISKSVSGDCFNKGTSISKLTTKYLGVNTKDFRPGLNRAWLKKYLRLSDNSKIILHAARIITGYREILKEKGIPILLEAFSRLSPRYQDIKLLIAIASPPKRLRREFNQALERLKGYIKLHNLETKVVYRKFKLKEMPLVYAGSDIFVLASENETLGQVYIEAMACGTPVIGANAGGVPEIIIDNYNGFLVQPNNSSALAQKIEELLYNEEIRKDFIKSGLKIIQQKFSVNRQFNILFRYLRELLRERKL